MILETNRLTLREMNKADTAAISLILQDKLTMYAYEHAFSDSEVETWIDRQITRYEQDGFGLWAMIDKATDILIGQCGITLQSIPYGNDEVQVHEIGYLVNRQFWGNGYATEAAIACRNYAFNNLGINAVYSIIRDNNKASQAVAVHNGMQVVGKFTKHYYNIDMPHLIYKVERA